MRILKVKGENLASLAGPFVVDFEVDPLGGTGLFAITGPTGSGKSTLLDAICLALYDRLPRLAAAESRAEIGRAEDTAGITRIKYDDVRGILRHGAGAGYAEVEFVGQDGRCYTARWDVRRARNRASGKLQAQTVTLTDTETGQPIGDKKTDSLLEIQKRVGLEFEQFRRAVLLAQGEFDSFIQADSRQRSELLERITGTRIYAEISKAAFQRAKSEREKRDELQRRLGSLPVLSDLERTQAEQRLNAATATLHQLTVKRDALAKAADWFTTHDRLAAVITEAETTHAEARRADRESAADRVALKTAKKAFGLRAEVEAAGVAGDLVRSCSEELATLAALRQEAERQHVIAIEAETTARAESDAARKAYDEIGPLLDKAANLDARIEEAVRDREVKVAALAVAETAHGTVQAAHADLQTRLDGAVADTQEHAAWLTAHKETRLLAERLDMVTGDLQSITALIRDIDALESAAATHNAAAGRSAKKREHAEAKRNQAGALVERLETVAGPLRETVAATDRPALHGTRSAVQEMRAAARNALGAAREVGLLTLSLDANARHTAEGRQKVETADETIRRVAQALPTAQARVEEARHGLLRSEASVTEQAERLRSLLEAGQPCPVCGATDHPFAVGAAQLDDRLKADRDRVSQLQTVVDGLIGSHAQASAETDAVRAELTRLHAERATLNSRLLEWQGAWANAVASIERSAPVATMEPPRFPNDPASDLIEYPLGQFEDTLAAQLSDIDARIAAYDDAERQLKEVESQLKERQQEVQSLRDEIGELTKAEAMSRSEANAARSLVKEKSAARNAIGRRLDTALRGVISDWEDHLRRDPVALQSSCNELAKEWVHRTAAIEAGHQLTSTLTADVRGAAASLAAAADRARLAGTDLQTATNRLAELRSERMTVIDGRPVSEVRTAHRVRAEGAEGDEKRATAKRNDAAKAFAEAGTKEASMRQSHQAAVTSLDTAEQKLAERLAAASLSREAAAAALEKGEHWIEREQHRLDELRNTMATAAATLGERRRALAEHEALGKPATDRETTLKSFAATENARQGAADEQASSLAAIKADDQARSKAADIRKELADLTAASDVWNQLDDLIGSADGAKFRRFVQALTLERLLRRSNHHLADLAPRYQLECAPGGDLALQVVDRHMGDEVRGVHNLSGGERFLVSLALALGLASMSTSQGIRVDTLFIDEGFGALDSTSLALAISTLESLQATGRKVGVISHIDELKERIGVQVQVIPRGGGRSEIEVIRT